MINEQGPFTFLLDTGVSASAYLLTTGMIEELSLERNVTAKPINIYHPADPTSIEFPLFGPAEVSIGRLTVSNIHFIETQNDSLNRYLQKHDIAGIIGIGGFRELALIIALDLTNQKLRIGRSAETLGLVSHYRVETAPLPSQTDTGRVGVLINIGGHDIPALLDTGSVFGLGLSITFRNKLATTGADIRSSSMTLGGEMEFIESTLQGNLTLGTHVIPNPAVKFNKTSNQYATIGYDILKNFYIIGFDYGNNRIYLD